MEASQIELVRVGKNSTDLMLELFDSVRDDPTIRADFGELLDLYKDPELLNQNLDWLYGKHHPSEFGYIAVNGTARQPVGIAAIRSRLRTDSTCEPREYYRVANLWYFVHQDFRRQGIARLMCERIISEAPKLSSRWPQGWSDAKLWTMIRSENSASRELALSLGLRPAGSSQVDDDNIHEYFIGELTGADNSLQ